MTSTPLPEQGGFNERLQMPSKDKAALDSELRTLVIEQIELPLSADARADAIVRAANIYAQRLANEAIGEDEPLVIPDYPPFDDEGEPLWSKRAAKEGRKQVTARYHARKELRAEQRQRLSKLLKESK